MGVGVGVDVDGIEVGVFVGIGVVAGAQAIRAMTKDRQAKLKKMDFFILISFR